MVSDPLFYFGRNQNGAARMKRSRLLHCTALVSALACFTPVLSHASDTIIPSGTSSSDELDVSGTDTVTVEDGATLETEDDAITFKKKKDATGVSITNSGTIHSTEGRAIRAKDADDMIRVATITNNEGASILADADDAIKFGENDANSSITIDNYGTIRSEDPDGSQAIDAADAYGVTIINESTGVISSSDADAIRTGIASVVYNYGTISVDTMGAGDGIDTRDGDNTGTTIYNYGTITGGKHGISGGDGDDFSTDNTTTVYNYGSITGEAGSGVGLDDNGIVYNYGTITGAWDGEYEGSGNGVDGDGVDIDQYAEIYNWGSIIGAGATGEKDGQENHSEGVAAGGGIIYNYAGAVIRGSDSGILIDDGDDGSALYATTIYNAGTIEGETYYAIKLVGDFDDTLVNTGSLIGGSDSSYVVDMGDGDDTVTINGGTITGGNVIGGDGTDALNFFTDGTTGTFTFDGDFLEFETASIQAGTVILHGALEASDSVSISSGATLQVDEGFETDDLLIYGTLAANSSSASARSFTVDSSFTLASSGIWQVVVDGDSNTSDKITVNGTATVEDGATISVLTTGVVTDNSSFTLIEADTLTADASAITVEDASLFYDWTLSTDDGSLILTATQTATLSGMTGTSGGAVLDSLASTATGDMATVIDTIESLSSEEAVQTAMNEVSPTPSGGTLNATSTTATAAANTIQNRMAAVRASHNGGGVTGSSFALSDTASLVSLSSKVNGAASTLADSMPTLGVASGSAPADSGFWVQGFGTAGLQGARGSSQGYSSRGVGFAVGADTMVSPDTLVGVAGTFARTFINGRGTQADDENTVDSYQISAYGEHSLGFGPFVEGMIGFARNSYDTSRVLHSLSREADADYDGWQGIAKIAVGHDLPVDMGTVTPMVSLQYAHTHIDAYTETGAGSVSESVAEQSYDTLTPALGARFALDPIEIDGGTLMPLLTATASYDAVADRQHVVASFVGGGGSFSTDGTKPARAALSVGAGAAFQRGAMTFSAGYEAEVRNSYQGHTALVQIRTDF